MPNELKRIALCVAWTDDDIPTWARLAKHGLDHDASTPSVNSHVLRLARAIASLTGSDYAAQRVLRQIEAMPRAVHARRRSQDVSP
jgi:hypothetical protein